MLRLGFLVTLLATGYATQATFASNDGGTLPNWATATAVPESVAHPVNVLWLDRDRLLWNGEEVSETDIRKLLGILANEIHPQPLTVLSYSARTPRGRIQRARRLVDEAIQCKPGECLEVISPGQTPPA